MDRSRARLLGLAVSVGLSITYLLLPPMGTDLSAAVAHGDFARAHPFTPVDLRWYGGTHQFGYSLLSQYVLASVGPRLTGALASVVAWWAFDRLLVVTGVRRPGLGSVLGAFAIAADLVSGRITYALGLALGLWALLHLLRGHRLRATGLALLTGAASPVAALFLALVCLPLLRRPEWRRVLAVVVATSAPVGLMTLLFSDGGINGDSRMDVLHGLLVVAAVGVSSSAVVVQEVCVLLVVLLTGAFFVRSPIGLNALRVPVMFALPVLVANARWRLVPTVAAATALWFVVPFVMHSDWTERDSPTLHASTYAPLLAQLDARGVQGRVEVPPTVDYGESAYLARHVDLARGWLRQADTRRNAVFFNDTLAPATYRRWLQDNGVQWVALSSAPSAGVGVHEQALVLGGLPYLVQVWQDPHWRLYEVQAPPVVVEGGRLEQLGSSTVRFTADGPGTVVVRVSHDRWLTVSGGACVGAEGRWTRVTVPRAGTYTLGSSLLAPFQGC